LDQDAVALPKGAWARVERRTLRRDGRPVLNLSQGSQRACRGVVSALAKAGFDIAANFSRADEDIGLMMKPGGPPSCRDR
jgi:hypothetical protein